MKFLLASFKGKVLDDFVDKLYFQIPDTSKILKSNEFVSSSKEKIKYTQILLAEEMEL